MAIIIIFSAAAAVVIWTGEQLNQLCLIITTTLCDTVPFSYSTSFYVVQCHVYIFNVHQDSFFLFLLLVVVCVRAEPRPTENRPFEQAV